MAMRAKTFSMSALVRFVVRRAATAPAASSDRRLHPSDRSREATRQDALRSHRRDRRRCARGRHKVSPADRSLRLWRENARTSGLRRLVVLGHDGENCIGAGECQQSAEADIRAFGCMVRPCGARGFVDLVDAVLHYCIRPLIGACAPGHHGYQRACDLILEQASNGLNGSPVFARAGKTDPPSSSYPLADLGG
jgi:hypothetical protein